MAKKNLMSTVVNFNGLERLSRRYKVYETHALKCGNFCVTYVDEAKDLNVTDYTK